jgi:transposase InsO family protein
MATPPVPEPGQSWIPPPQQMDMKGHLPTNWQFFRDSWENYEIATELNLKTDAVRVATLLSIIGKECFLIFKNLPLSEDDRKKLDKVLEGLTKYFEPQRNTVYERYVFNTCCQESHESIDNYVHRLRKLSATCEFDTLRNEMIRDRIVIGVRDSGLRARLLREKDLTLERCIDSCRASEMSSQQLKAIDGGEVEAVHAVHKKKFSKKSEKSDRPKSKKKKNCSFCGTQHPKRKCPAWGQQCKKCKKFNHFDSVCRNNGAAKVHQVETESDEEDEDEEETDDASVFAVLSGRTKYLVEPSVRCRGSNTWKKQVLQLDNGAAVNCMSFKDCCELQDTKEPLLKKSTKNLTSYSGTRLQNMGQITVEMMINGKQEYVKFQVVKDVPCSLLNGETAERFGLMKVKEKLLINQVTSELTEDEMMKAYSDVFEGLGDLGEYHIEMDPAIKPMQDAPRTVPVALKKDLKKKLESMESQGVIKKITEPTDWISSMVAVKKPNKLRICLDPKELNKAVKIPKYKLPTLDDVSANLSKAKIFSVVDAKDGFLQVRLDEESSKLTTFSTPFGRYRWLRLPFGISSAPEEFQRRVLEIVEGLEGVETIADDVLIYGSGDTMEEAIADHDKNMIALLKRCRERNFKLNKSKVRFKQASVKYHGHVLSREGVKPDPQKVEAIQNMPRPDGKKAVKRLIGMTNYLAKFCPHLSTVSEPLRRLTDESAEFVWSEQHESTFKTIKTMMATAPVLRYYSVTDEVTVEADSSEYGLGAVLLQGGQPVAFASRTLSKTERNYSQMEKECLAITFACNRFDQYLHGRDNITVLTDHQNLEVIFKKPILAAPKRLQRMRLRLQKYHIDVQYQKGKLMYISDALSRATTTKSDAQRMQEADYEIFRVEEELRFYQEVEEITYPIYSNVSDQTMEKIKQSTSRDEALQTMMKMVYEGWPSDKTQIPLICKEYWPYRDEISCQDGIMYRGTRVIIPTSLRKQMLDQVHASHQGVDAAIRKARDAIYWPQINNDIKNTVATCNVCLEHQPSQQKEPMYSQPIPKGRFEVVSTDLFSIKGETYLVVVDHFSKYWEIGLLKETTAEAVIEELKQHFARHGIPKLVISDNGPQYQCQEFKKFANEWKFTHHTSSPHHPLGNATAEAAVKVAKNILKRAKEDGRDPWLAILEHRNTPSADNTGSSVQKLMSRRTKSLIPIRSDKLEPKIIPSKDVVNSQVLTKQRAKARYDKHAKELPALVIGQRVRAQIKPQSSTSWTAGRVVEKLTPRSYVIEADNKQYRRNRNHIRSSKEVSVPKPKIEPTEPEILLPQDQEEPPTQNAASTSKSPENVAVSNPASSQNTRRSGRARRAPKHLEDFVPN